MQRMMSFHDDHHVAGALTENGDGLVGGEGVTKKQEDEGKKNKKEKEEEEEEDEEGVGELKKDGVLQSDALQKKCDDVTNDGDDGDNGKVSEKALEFIDTDDLASTLEATTTTTDTTMTTATSSTTMSTTTSTTDKVTDSEGTPLSQPLLTPPFDLPPTNLSSDPLLTKIHSTKFRELVFFCFAPNKNNNDNIGEKSPPQQHHNNNNTTTTPLQHHTAQ